MKEDYKFTFNWQVKKGYDPKAKKECLDVVDEQTKKVTRFYYEFVQREFIENMPDNILSDLQETINKEVERRGTNAKFEF